MLPRGHAVNALLGGLLCAGLAIMMAWTTDSTAQARCGAEIGLADPQQRQVQVFCSGYTVRATTEKWASRHYKIFGNLIIPSGKTLEIRNSLVEIVSDYPREHVVSVEGGTLSTVDTQIGGTAKAGVFNQTIFTLKRDGKGKFLPRWTMSNTLVQYSYGILHSAGTLEAWNIQQGPSPDGLLVVDTATAILHGGTFNIAFNADARTGTESVLDLPSNKPLTGVYSGDEPSDSGRRIPGMTSRLELDEAKVPLWFLFVNNVTTTSSSRTTLRLRDVQSVIPSINAVDFDGEMTLRTTWVNDSPKWNLALPAGTMSTAGNLVIRTETDRTSIPCWSFYLARKSMQSPRAIVRGPTSICELFTFEGTRAEVIGTPGTFDTHLNGTTIELSKNSSVLARNVVVGSLLGREYSGHIGAKEPGAVAWFENARLRDIDTLSDSRATVFFADSIPFTFPDGSRAKALSRGRAAEFVRSAFTATSPSGALRNDLRWAGLRIRIGRRPLRVTRLGRHYTPGDAGEHEVRLYKADGRVLGGVSLHASRNTDYLGFNYASLREMIMLEPDAEYILVSREDTHDRFADDATTVNPQAGELFVVGAVSSSDGVRFQRGRPSHSFGPLNLQYVDELINSPAP